MKNRLPKTNYNNQAFIEARFKGRMFSLGYIKWKKYSLKTWGPVTYNGQIMHIIIQRMDGTGLCPYSSKESFEANWDVL